VAGDVEASGTEGDAMLVVDEDVLAPVSLGIDAGTCAGVEVEDTNGGEFWTYEPSGWTA
jgi:hypothetical protein